MSEYKCYILVDNHTSGMQNFEFLKGQGQNVRIAPAPREAKSSCGIAILCDCDNIDEATRLLIKNNLAYRDVVRVEQSFNPHRDVFC